MKLFYSPTSPYVRKVMMVAHETGQIDTLELTTTAITPINPDDTLNASNPLGKVPALQLDDGSTLFDSRVIVDYLNDRSSGVKVIPDAGAERWAAYRRQALADGVLDAGILVRYETFLRPKNLYWEDWHQGQLQKMLRGVAAMATDIDQFGSDMCIGQIAFGAALGYLEFRYPDLGWRDSHGNLATWYDSFASRASMQKTMPPEG